MNNKQINQRINQAIEDLENNGCGLSAHGLKEAVYALSFLQQEANVARLEASLKGTQRELAKASDRIMDLIHTNNDLVLERDKWKGRTEKLANFNPDWDMLEATQESLREHMRICRELQEQPTSVQQEAEPVGRALASPNNTGNTIATFNADRVPVGAELYTTPQPAKVQVPDVDDMCERAKGWREWDCPEGLSTEERIIYGACRSITSAMLSASPEPAKGEWVKELTSIAETLEADGDEWNCAARIRALIPEPAEMTCPHCGGTGQVYDPYPDVGPSEYMTCPTCRGRKTVKPNPPQEG